MEYNAVDVTPSLAVLQIADARGGAMGIRHLVPPVEAPQYTSLL
jgi:hypothetical protein